MPEGLVTNFTDLNPDKDRAATYIKNDASKAGMTPQEYLDSRGGFDMNVYTYGDVVPFLAIDEAAMDAARQKGVRPQLDILRERDKIAWSKDLRLIDDKWLQYAVRDGWVTPEQAANAYYGANWGRRFSQVGIAQFIEDPEKRNEYLSGLPDVGFKSGSSSSGGSSATSSSSSASGSGSGGMTPAQENAFALLQKTFESYGLGSLAPAILNLVKQGYASDTVSLLLQETPEYQKRFAANDARRKAGMAVLSPAEYLATEKAYRQVMNAAGLPKGFYDQQEDFTDLLSKDISPAELNARVANATDAVLNADPYYTQSLRDMYGMTNGDMIAFVLNPDRSLPIIQQKANAVSFGAAASRQGMGVDTAIAEMYGGQGVGKAQAEQGFAQIATTLPMAEKLGQIYGDDFNQMTAIAETFGNDQQAAQKRRRLVQSEVDTFGGQSGVRGGSLSQATQGLI